MLYGQFPVYGQAKVAAKFWSSGKVGRVDFQLRNIGMKTVKVGMFESTLDGSTQVQLGTDVEIVPGGIVTLSVSTAKPAILFKSSTTNLDHSLINLDAQFLGRPFYGQLDIAENLPNSSFGGADINGSAL